MKKILRIGAHTSIAGGLPNALSRSEAIGANTLQIFAKSPRWRSIPPHTDEELQECLVQRKSTQQLWGLIHSNYLANLSKPFEDCKTDIASILDDFIIAQATGYEAVNIHIGKWKWFSTRDEAMKNMVKNVEYIISQNQKKNISVQFVFENTARQWSELGSTIEELSYFHQNYLKGLPVKFCIDTCHAFAGGIDITDFDKVIDQFATHIGIDQLYCFHLNDSKAPLWARLDRHASLWKWFIGRPALSQVIKRAYENSRPLFIETPDNDIRPQEISQVKKIISGDESRIPSFHQKHFKTMTLKKFEEKGLF